LYAPLDRLSRGFSGVFKKFLTLPINVIPFLSLWSGLGFHIWRSTDIVRITQGLVVHEVFRAAIIQGADAHYIFAGVGGWTAVEYAGVRCGGTG
jgi:hypothetical protein